MALNFPPPPPLQFLQPDNKTIGWNWHFWFQQLQTLAGHLDFLQGSANGFTITYSGTNKNTATISITDSGGAQTILGWAMTNQSIAPNQIVTVPAGYQMESHYEFTVNGIFNVNGNFYLENSYTPTQGFLIYSIPSNSANLILWA